MPEGTVGYYIHKSTLLIIGCVLPFVVSYEARDVAYCNKPQNETSEYCKKILGSSAIHKFLFLAVNKLQCTQVPQDGDLT
jgi:hypothetical protein